MVAHDRETGVEEDTMSLVALGRTFVPSPFRSCPLSLVECHGVPRSIQDSQSVLG